MERPMPTNDEKLMAMLIYVSSFFTYLIGPLIIWLIKRDQSEFVNYHGKEYLNFLISYSIYILVSSILMVFYIGFILAPVVGILSFTFTIIAAVKSYGGETYRIPTVIRFIK